MGFNQDGSTVTHRFPVGVPLMDRVPPQLGVTPFDPFLKNCFLERSPNGNTYIIKRPGLVAVYSYASGGASNGQGMYYYNDYIFAMGSNILYRLSGAGANAYSLGTGWANPGNAAWNARRSATTIVFQNQIWIMGGYDGTSYYSDIWSSPDGTTWVQVVAVAPWGKRTGMKAVVFNNQMYVMGGANAGTFYNDVWSSSDGLNWQLLTNSAAWSARNAFGLVAFNNGMFITGGALAVGNSNEVWYSTDGANWELVFTGAAFGQTSSHSMLVYDDKMWVIGGVLAGNTVYSSPDGKVWTQTTAAAFASARYEMTAWVYAGVMWIAAGYTGATYLDDVYKSAVGGAGAWTLVTAAPGFSTRLSAMGVVFKAPTSVSATNAPVLWLMGGQDNTGTYKNDLWYTNADGSMSTSWSLSTSGATTEQFQFTTINNNQYLCLKNTYSLWTLYADQLAKVTDKNYPARTVAGIVNLNSTIYVMDLDGVIYGSDLQDPTTWNSLNFLTAEYEADRGVCIAKLQNYVVALKANTTQFFYDSGSFPGTSLRPVQNANLRIGCASAGSVVAMDNTLVYMAQTFQAGRSIVSLNGFSPVKISNPYIDRYLDKDSLSQVFSYSIKRDGHDFYILTLVNSNITLAYDLVEKEWHVMQSGDNLVRFKCNNYVTDGFLTLLQDETVGLVYSYLPTVYTDQGLPITTEGIGDLVDFQSGQYKYCSRLQLVGDKDSSTNFVDVYISDNNYQSFSLVGTVNMADQRPKIDRMGRFERRAHKFRHLDARPLRLQAWELTILPGDV